ncbi:uncharacterized protein MYCFIDRAFT_201745 [Pseudocercospora fijiensis CIRAD86]|uniref:Uncharacterized protein n=1 Tax=Pseudocercospora fijiensis (strain CIRAD86) TaxID=383855 RepID=N1QC70_PSEFD|nr:uncharacterized protein MYCFIDRAFT_201745 [Pseudocercospora fijiensis CIRAD86]EME88997.1 hypothetical protein MYCFIDRAFT_201745 [Pseudocercospora fijiensis CIRAD86]
MQQRRRRPPIPGALKMIKRISSLGKASENAVSSPAPIGHYSSIDVSSELCRPLKPKRVMLSARWTWRKSWMEGEGCSQIRFIHLNP